MKQCPTCGATYDAAVRFCVRDGTALVAAPFAPTYSPPAPGRARLARLSVPVLVLAGAVVGLLILLAALLLRQSGEDAVVEIASEPQEVEPASPAQVQRAPRIGYVQAEVGYSLDAEGTTQLVLGRERDGGERYIFALSEPHQGGGQARINVDGLESTVYRSGRARQATAFDRTIGANRTYTVAVFRPGDRSFEVEVWTRYGETGADCTEVFGGVTVRKRGQQTHERVSGSYCSF